MQSVIDPDLLLAELNKISEEKKDPVLAKLCSLAAFTIQWATHLDVEDMPTPLEYAELLSEDIYDEQINVARFGKN